MVNHETLMDRFGDQEFLHELWMKARNDLPGRLTEVRPLIKAPEQSSPDILAKLLHKLRGLVANFLTESDAIPQIAKCEKLIEKNEIAHLSSEWTEFESALKREVEDLDAYLAKAGFELPTFEF